MVYKLDGELYPHQFYMAIHKHSQVRLDFFIPTSLVAPKSTKTRVTCYFPFDKTLGHFISAVKKRFDSQIRKQNDLALIGCEFYDSVSYLDPSLPWTTWIDPDCQFRDSIDLCLILKFNNKEQNLIFPVNQHHARIMNCSLDVVPMVGCPIGPTIECENLCFDQSEFWWYVSKSDTALPDQPCHKGFVFIPKVEQIGLKLHLAIRVRNSHGQDGLPFGKYDNWTPWGQIIHCPYPISQAPHQPFHEKRYQCVPTSRSDQFRVVTYNILADKHSRGVFARQQIFPHCPPQFLSISYRLPLLVKELLAYRADVLCLQEVDYWLFHFYLRWIMKFEGELDGFFIAKQSDQKSQTSMEGTAIFFRPSRFELVEQVGLPSIMAYASQHPKLSSQWSSLVETPNANPVNVEKSQTQSLLAALFRFKDPNTPHELNDRYLIVATTHLFFKPDANEYRHLQALAIRTYLSELITQYRTRCNNTLMPIILAGDLNKSPNDTKLLNYLCQPTHPDDLPYELKSAYNPESLEFTNWVPGFYTTLDFLLHTSSDLDCIRTLPGLTRSEMAAMLANHAPSDSVTQANKENPNPTNLVDPLDRYALPNQCFPSDHLALVADFQLEPSLHGGTTNPIVTSPGGEINS